MVKGGEALPIGVTTSVYFCWALCTVQPNKWWIATYILTLHKISEIRNSWKWVILIFSWCYCVTTTLTNSNRITLIHSLEQIFLPFNSINHNQFSVITWQRGLLSLVFIPFEKKILEIKIGELMKKEKIKTVELFPLINIFVRTIHAWDSHQLSLPPLVNVPSFF